MSTKSEYNRITLQ